MNHWFSKSLGDGIVAWEPLDRIKTVFLSEYKKAGCPKDMAVFIRHESEGSLHCEVKAYFSPATFIVANKIDADRCTRPSPDNLSLLAGSEDSWPLFFPESGR